MVFPGWEVSRAIISINFVGSIADRNELFSSNTTLKLCVFLILIVGLIIKAIKFYVTRKSKLIIETESGRKILEDKKKKFNSDLNKFDELAIKIAVVIISIFCIIVYTLVEANYDFHNTCKYISSWDNILILSWAISLTIQDLDELIIKSKDKILSLIMQSFSLVMITLYISFSCGFLAVCGDYNSF